MANSLAGNMRFEAILHSFTITHNKKEAKENKNRNKMGLLNILGSNTHEKLYIVISTKEA